MGGGIGLSTDCIRGRALIVVKHSNEYVKSETATAIDSVRIQMTILTNLGNKLRVIGYISQFCIDISYKRHPWVVQRERNG